VLAIGGRPALLDRFDQSGRAVGDDQHRRPRARAGDQVAPELKPVLVGLAHPQHHRQKHAFSGIGEPPRHEHALLGPVGADREKDRVE
jgi:hypothetical protein